MSEVCSWVKSTLAPVSSRQRGLMGLLYSIGSGASVEPECDAVVIKLVTALRGQCGSNYRHRKHCAQFPNLDTRMPDAESSPELLSISVELSLDEVLWPKSQHSL